MSAVRKLVKRVEEAVPVERREVVPRIETPAPRELPPRTPEELVPEERKVKNARLGLTHNLGGRPWQNVAAISIIGRD